MDQVIEVTDADGVTSLLALRTVARALAASGLTTYSCLAEDGQLISLRVSLSPAPPANVGGYETPEQDPRLFAEPEPKKG